MLQVMAAANAKGFSFFYISLSFLAWAYLEKYLSLPSFRSLSDIAVGLGGIPSLTRPRRHTFFNHGKAVLNNSFLLLPGLRQHKYLGLMQQSGLRNRHCAQPNCAKEGGGLGLAE